MKKLFFGIIVFAVPFLFSKIVPAEELVVDCYQEGSESYSYNFQKAVEIKEERRVCRRVDKFNHPLLNDVLKIPGVEWASIEKYSVVIIKGKAFSKEKIEKGITQVLKKYFKAGKVVIIDKEETKRIL